MARRPWSNFKSDMADAPKLAWDNVLAWRTRIESFTGTKLSPRITQQ